MTEPRRPARPRPGRELRRWIIAALALGHVAVWRVVSRPPARATAPEVVPVGPSSATVTAPAVVWLDELAVRDRPVVGVPAGWRIVDRHAAVAAPAAAAAPASPRLVRAPTTRSRRVRTRSS